MSGPEVSQLSLRREQVIPAAKKPGVCKDVNFQTRLRGLAVRNGLSAAESTPLECLLQIFICGVLIQFATTEVLLLK